ncbi:DnaJ domain-containing protein [Hymenobacter negativus]|uniref:DnaJ domain-containing protein n=1 Tax=Hymenobacter negativus TaxID=2795026 RepID=A0ABS3QBB5_9BACT|nr:DnaJ domain-containing protein [Hymenobacter negativus]MBO2008555.1 DnaJ domain-containing protein [Hymenobacter negativus]
MSQNHYQVLGVAPDAPAAEIKRAYRQLVVRYHPDKHGGDVRYEDQFKSVAVAYGVLSDPGKRATYDFQLAQAARRAQEAQRRQQHRPATQHVYGVPMPPPAPLRTRPPAGARERHYQRIPKQRARFNARDWLLTGALLLGIVLFSLAVKVTMDRITANSNYRDGLRAYTHGQWATAYTFLDESLHFRPDHAPTLARLGELDLLINHDPRSARASFQAALLHPQSPHSQASLFYFLGRCEAMLGNPSAAELHFTRALVLDSMRSSAYLARGETRLLDLGQTDRAVNDFSTGLEQRKRAGSPTPWHYMQLRGVAYTSLNRYAEARDDYFRVIRANPTDGRTHFLLGRLATRTGDSAAACEFYSRAVRLGYEYARTAQRSCGAEPPAKPRTAPPASDRPKSKQPPLAQGQRRLPKL